ncbi:phage baseplate assembly protein V [Pseudoalteromonas sp. R3]|uniref:phage baseplate assembly protein V n=1 Tax=Pseudoalteromonas sp. R3 TaxID=1709477 RepID=UPI0006B50D13|nr:phage baseplate assembly protein V [Pseudoalteromonas sp. R3]AZZ98008.1 phage baseplate assembly protein V [Pseudoalteromonas sp. R3]
MNIAAELAELKRRIDNLIRLGTVAEVKSGYCRVKTGEITTDFRPYLTHRAGTAKTSWRPSIDEQVILLSLSGDINNAYVLPALYSDDNPEPDDHETRLRTTFPDGAVFEYDPETSQLRISGIRTALIEVTESTQTDCPDNTINGNVTINGETTLNGDIAHTGHMTNVGGIQVDDIEFGEHGHKDVKAGTDIAGEPV